MSCRHFEKPPDGRPHNCREEATQQRDASSPTGTKPIAPQPDSAVIPAAAPVPEPAVGAGVLWQQTHAGTVGYMQGEHPNHEPNLPTVEPEPAALLLQQMRFALSPGGLLIQGEVARLFEAALPYVERASRVPHPDRAQLVAETREWAAGVVGSAPSLGALVRARDLFRRWLATEGS